MAKSVKKSSKELIINLSKKLARLEDIDSGELTRSTHRVHASEKAYKREKFTVKHWREGVY